MMLTNPVQLWHASKSTAFPDSRFEPTRPLAFMHIPKTSGTSLTTGLREALHPGAETIGFDLSMFGPFDAFETIAPDIRRIIHRDLLRAQDAPDFVAGHLAYSTIVRSRPNAQLLTILREPRSRLLSHWAFWRAQPDDGLNVLGAWGDIMRLARRPLLDFLARREVACQTDNIAVRMLLWPHPLIPDGDFIDSTSDARLIDEAAMRLKGFAFTDIIENPQIEANLRTWLARPFAYARANETSAMAPELRVPLSKELVPQALRTIEHRSRLDRQLWLALAGERIAAGEVQTLSNDTFLRTVARHGALMAA